jgi:hypothetical protein
MSQRRLLAVTAVVDDADSDADPWNEKSLMWILCLDSFNLDTGLTKIIMEGRLIGCRSSGSLRIS